MGVIGHLVAFGDNLKQRLESMLLGNQLKRGGVAGYLIALALMALALLLRLAAAPLDAGLQYLTFFPAIALAAVIGGLGPGVFAIVVGIGFASFILFPPYYTISLTALQQNLWSNIIFFIDGIIVCLLVEGLRRYQDKLSDSGMTLKQTGQIIQTTSEGFWLCDTSGKLLEVNDSYCRMTGYTRQELLAMRITDLEANESPEEIAEHTRQLIAWGHGVFETRHRRKDGSLVDVEVSASFSAGYGGAFIVFVRNISERKRAENELRDSEERFRQLFEKAPVGIAMARQDQKIFIANAALCSMFGYTQEELRHLSITDDLTHPDYRNQTRGLVAGVLKGDFPIYSTEKKYLRKGGKAFWGRIVATEIKSSVSQSRLIMGIVEDITERIEREERRLTEVKEQKDTLVREVHHRIKNNLQGVIGLLQQYTSAHPQIADVIGVLVGRIYSIALIHGLQAQTLTEEINLSGLMENIISASGCAAKYTDELLRPVLLNRDEAVPVALVLNELVTNACKYQPSGGTISVSVKGDYPEVVISVSNLIDTGKASAPGGGQGLKLVKSLLPKKSAALQITQVGDIFSVCLKLTQPVVIFDLCSDYDQGGRPCPYILSCWSKTTA